MDTLTINKENAQKAFNGADETGKQLLINLLGEEVFKKPDYEKALEEWNTFCNESGSNSTLPYPKPADKNQQNTNAYEMIKAIVKHENGRVANGMDTSENKYYPWFDVNPSSGFGLSYFDFGRWTTYSCVPARLCSVDSSKVKPIAEKYPAIYKILQLK